MSAQGTSTSRLVRRAVGAGESPDYAAVGRDDHVQDEGEARLVHRENHVAVYWVAVERSGAGAFVRDEFRAVVRKHRLPRGHAREDRFAPAVKAREEVRLDEALRDEKIRLDRGLVELQASAGGQDSAIDHGRIVAAVVHDDFLPRDDFFPEFPDQLFARRPPVEPGRDEQRHVDRPVAPPQPLQHRRNQHLRRNRARVVAEDYRGGLRSGGEFFELRAADRVVERFFDLRASVGGRLRQRSLENAEKPLVRDLGCEPGAVVWDGNFHGGSKYSQNERKSLAMQLRLKRRCNTIEAVQTPH